MQVQLLRNRGDKLCVPHIANLGVFNKRVGVCVCAPLDSQVQLRNWNPLTAWWPHSAPTKNVHSYSCSHKSGHVTFSWPPTPEPGDLTRQQAPSEYLTKNGGHLHKHHLLPALHWERHHTRRCCPTTTLTGSPRPDEEEEHHVSAGTRSCVMDTLTVTKKTVSQHGNLTSSESV